MSKHSAEDVLTKLAPLIKQLDPEDIITASHKDYNLHAAPFSTKANLSPPVVLIPSNTEVLSTIVSFLYSSSLDFRVRGQGFGSPSALDVIVSLLRFTSFEYDPRTQLATVGTGNTWVKVADEMQKVDPQYSITVARTPSIGVGGAILHGGYSWMSSEFGCISDPLNFIDAEVVKHDGTIVMASTEPDLLWALRGSGGGFGIMTKAVLRAHKYSTAIWSGIILVPRKYLRQLAVLIRKFISKPQDPTVNCLMYLVQEFMLTKILNENQLKSVDGDMFAIHAYDAAGEAHGREAFSWALNMPNMIDLTIVTDTKGVLDMQQNVATLRGTMATFHALPLAVADLDIDDIMRTMMWHEKAKDVDPDIFGLTMTVLELLVFSPPAGGMSEVAWPRGMDTKHYILLISGCPPDGTPELQEKARQLIRKAPQEILGERDYVVMPPGLDDLQDPKKTYALHWDRLVELRKRYDPKQRFWALINP